MNRRKKFRTAFTRAVPNLLAAGLLAACSAAGGPAVPPSAPASAASAERTLLALYMVGSNLEDDVKPRNGTADERETGTISTVGASSFDLRELLTAWQALSPEARARLDVVVAFGGARKQGWQGVKYADLSCLASDGGDNYFGNASCYSYAKAEANMADPGTLSHFLAYLGQHYAADGRKVFEIWNHGLSFLGAGQDSTQSKATDYLTLPEMKQAFGTGKLHFDLLAFDACLMGSLEVAHALSPFADYMVASEELEPGHGWHYGDVLNAFAQNTDIAAAGKKLVDSYLDQPAHQKPTSNQKTLALLDLRQVAPVRQALDTLVGKLGSSAYAPLLLALTQSQHFGSEPMGKLSYTIDLRDWAGQVKALLPAAAAEATGLESALDKLVLHARHDANKPNANGISIYSLNQSLQPRYGKDQSPSTAWLSFTRNFIAKGSADASKPAVTRTTPSSAGFATAQQKPADLCQQGGKSGHCLSITDDLGLASVEQVFALEADQRYLYSIGSERLQADRNQYFAPVWNGEWFLVCDGDCSSGKSLFPPAYFDSLTERGNRIYSAEAELNGLPVVFYLERGRNNAVVNQWAVPYEIGSAGEVILAREQLPIATGDTLAFWYQVHDLQTSAASWKKGEALRFGRTPAWSFARIDAPRAYYVAASDYKGNLALSDIYELR